MRKFGAFQTRKNAARQKVLDLYRRGHTPAEIIAKFETEPRRNIYRWIAEARDQKPGFAREHLRERQSQEIEEPVPVGDNREQVTLFRDDQLNEVQQRGTGVYSATGDPSTWERQLFRQQVLRGCYVEPRFNFSLLQKLRLVDELSIRRTADEYFRITKRKISTYWVRKLLENVEVIWDTEADREWLARSMMGQALFEEQRRVLAKHIKEEPDEGGASRYARIFIEGPAGWLENQQQQG